MNICIKCKNNKDKSLFSKSKRAKDGLQATCKQCAKEYKDVNRAKSIEQCKKYYYENKEKAQEHNKIYYKENREIFIQRSRERYVEKKDDLLEKAKIYYINNKEEINKKKTIYTLNRLKIDPLYKLTMNIRSLIRSSFKLLGPKKNSKTAQILGCTFQEFKDHLEKQFDEHMTWENQGSYWHMDHIKPVSLAINEQELIILNHYTNFQPLKKYTNLRKSAKYNENNLTT